MLNKILPGGKTTKMLEKRVVTGNIGHFQEI